MEAIFNELSLQPQFHSPKEISNAIDGLLNTFKEAKKHGFTIIRLHDPRHKISLATSYTLEDWLNDEGVSKNSKNDLLAIVDTPFTYQQESTYFDSTNNLKINFLTQSIEIGIGVKVAYKLETLSLSLLDEQRKIWDTPELTIDDAGAKCKIPHASKPEHILHYTIAWPKVLSGWQPNIENLFPNTRAKELPWLKEPRGLNQSDRIAQSRHAVKRIAQANGWKYNKEISTLNSNSDKLRDIYDAGSGRNRMFISADMEGFGRIEVCDFRGKHLGEYNLHGSKIKEADSNHNIKL